MQQVRILSPRCDQKPAPNWILSRSTRGGFLLPAGDDVVRVWLRDGTHLDRQDDMDARTMWFATQPKPRTIETTQAKGKGKGRSKGLTRSYGDKTTPPLLTGHCGEIAWLICQNQPIQNKGLDGSPNIAQTCESL